MSKKTIRNILIILFIAAVGFLLYFFFFRNTNEDLGINIERGDLTNPFGDFLPGDREDADRDFSFDFPNRDSNLRLITANPVSGFRLSQELSTSTDSLDENSLSENSTSTEMTTIQTELLINYVQRNNGNIFEARSSEIGNERISNTTIPKVYEALFFNDSDSLIYRTLDENLHDVIVTYLATFDNEGEATSTQMDSLEGVFLTDNIRNITVSENDDVFALLINDEPRNTYSVGYLFNSDEISDPEVIFESEITEFITEWVDDRYIAMTTKPSYLAEGYSYVLDTQTNELIKVLNRKIGLTTNYSPDSNKVLYSYNTNGFVNTYFQLIDDREEISLGLSTLAEKCAWGPESVFLYCAISNNVLSGDFPDAWYKGQFNFDDVLISINTETFESEIILNREDRPTQLDIYNMKVSPNNDYLVFQNKLDLSLWMLDLTN